MKREFETAIADEIIREIVRTLPTLASNARSPYLNEKLGQFNQGVDLSLVSERIRQEHRLLSFLVSSELDQRAPDIILRANAMSSVSWQFEDYDQRIQADLHRLNLDIAGKSESSEGFDLAALMQQVRAASEYPDDSVEGRQSYLDALADAMYTIQVDWFDLLTQYENSSLAVFGEDSESFMFRYNDGELTVNLSHVSYLPLSELEPVAAFYGFPGLEALRDKSGDSSLRSLLNLHGYELGWASFIVSRMAQHERSPESFLYFEKLLMSLAWLDLKLNSGHITTNQAEAYLIANTPYEPGRIAMQVKEVQATPGRYLAAAAGKLTLNDLLARCIEGDTDCDASFNQLVIERGAMPFDMLTRRLERQ